MKNVRIAPGFDPAPLVCGQEPHPDAVNIIIEFTYDVDFCVNMQIFGLLFT